MSYRLALVLLCASFFVPGTAKAQVALSLKIGTLGPSGEVVGRITPSLNVRVGGSYLPFSTDGAYTEEIVDLAYSSDATLMTASAIVDYFPFANTFRVSAGIAYNGTKVSAFVEPTEGYTVGNRTFTAQELGSLTGNGDYDSKVSPYVGIGIGNPVRVGKRLGFVLDVGALYTAAPGVELEGTGMIAPTAEQANLINDKLSGIKLWPVVALGVSFAF